METDLKMDVTLLPFPICLRPFKPPVFQVCFLAFLVRFDSIPDL